MPISVESVPYGSELATAIVTGLVATGVWWNRQRRDNSKTTLQEKQDKISGDFMENIMADHLRVVAQLKEADAIRTVNAERIGALTAEVNHLRDQICDVRSFLKEVSDKLDTSNTAIQGLQTQLNTKDGAIIRITAEKDAAIHRAADWETRYNLLKQRMGDENP